MRTWTVRPGDIERDWHVVDATDLVLGRMATQVASILKGKHSPKYSPHADCGDHVIVINAEKIKVTGRKSEQKVYYRHTGYVGGLKTTSYQEMLENTPTRIIEAAVRGMLPKNPLGRQMFLKLKVYAGDQHPHQAQQPKPLSLV